MMNQYASLPVTKPTKTRRQKSFLWLSFLLFFAVSSCTDTGLLVAVEDAKGLSDGNLSNYLFVHSMAQIGTTVYLGSKQVWRKTDSGDKWSKVGLPSSLDPDATPVVSIATDGTNLFVASSEKVYAWDGSSWSSTVLDRSSVGFNFYALRGTQTASAATVLAADKSNNVYQYSGGAWGSSPLLSDTKMNDFAVLGSKFFLASGTKLKSGTGLDALSDMTSLPNGDKQITNILAVTTGSGSEYLAMLSNGTLYLYDNAAGTWSDKGSNSSTNIGLGQIGDQLIVGRFEQGYQIYDMVALSWKGTASSDGFTDTDSLVTLSSGASIQSLSLDVFLFYDDSSDDTKDRVYAATQSSDGVFGAKRDGSLWSWGLE
ncbi:hypothetical protein P0082_01855 [Candidatus Haliotispira prima]|uniref:Photosynthesis system II assembly factor Ycf48/Hcf136-like domain-containing protein n=1 Tax=Candidatus Haliotispira prima TaxID=3034016 RepID=A0ABY8MHX5_9SPIO|nr:hypothetical protein P0082_01855 [Candidatus Haliotispira prima]